MGRERTLAFILAGLFVFMTGSVIADSNSVSLDSEIINMPEHGWYGVGDVVEIDGVLKNTGDATSISIDPSCDSVLRIWQDNSLLIDGTDSCFGQNRGLDIGTSASIDLETLSWDLRDSNGMLLCSLPLIPPSGIRVGMMPGCAMMPICTSL